LDLNALHSNGFTEFDVHNLFGLQQAYKTSSYFINWVGNNMPFIVSKSTFPGFNKYGGHLVDLPDCTWESM